MLSFLKDHPFAVEAFFDTTLVLTYAVAPSAIKHLIPECLELDTFNDQWAFLALAVVKTTGLRPRGFPKFLGNDFILLGYRAFVKYHTNAGKRLRGLYILKSETNSHRMKVTGNIFTHYNYTNTDILWKELNGQLIIESLYSGISIVANTTETDPQIPQGSPFTNWKEARRFTGPLPFTFSYHKATRRVLIIEGVRDQWTPLAVDAIESDAAFIRQLTSPEPVLANAFIIRNVPYYWKKGKSEIWKGQ